MIQGIAEAARAQVVVEPAPVERLTSVSPEPETAEEKEVDGLLRQWIAGGKNIAAAELPKIPDTATKNERATARFFANVYALRLTVDQEEPVLFCCDWAAGWMTLLGYEITGRTVARNLRKLELYGVLRFMGTRKIPGRPKPANLWLPGVGADPVREFVRHDHAEPEVEAVQDGLVRGAVGAVGDRPLTAARNGAGDGGGFHA